MPFILPSILMFSWPINVSFFISFPIWSSLIKFIVLAPLWHSRPVNGSFLFPIWPSILIEFIVLALWWNPRPMNAPSSFPSPSWASLYRKLSDLLYKKYSLKLLEIKIVDKIKMFLIFIKKSLRDLHRCHVENNIKCSSKILARLLIRPESNSVAATIPKNR